MGWQATNGDGQRDAPSKEARKEEGPVKEKLENKAGYGERQRGQPGSPKKGMEQGDRPTNVDQSTAMVKKPRKEASKVDLQDLKGPDTGAEPRPG